MTRRWGVVVRSRPIQNILYVRKLRRLYQFTELVARSIWLRIEDDHVVATICHRGFPLFSDNVVRTVTISSVGQVHQNASSLVLGKECKNLFNPAHFLCHIRELRLARFRSYSTFSDIGGPMSLKLI